MAESKMETFFKEHIDTQRLLKNSRKTLKTYYLSRLMMEHCEEKSSRAEWDSSLF